MYTDFASWLQSRLLRIYASPAHSAHHEKTTHVHTVILSVIKDQDKDAFIYLISKLIKLLSGKCIHMYIGLQCALYSMKVLRQSRNTAVNANCLFLSQNLKKKTLTIYHSTLGQCYATSFLYFVVSVVVCKGFSFIYS